MTEPKTGFTFTKHYDNCDLEHMADTQVVINVPEESNVTQMCYAFHRFLEASGYHLPDEHTIGVVHECELDQL